MELLLGTKTNTRDRKHRGSLGAPSLDSDIKWHWAPVSVALTKQEAQRLGNVQNETVVDNIVEVEDLTVYGHWHLITVPYRLEVPTRPKTAETAAGRHRLGLENRRPSPLTGRNSNADYASGYARRGLECTVASSDPCIVSPLCPSGGGGARARVGSPCRASSGDAQGAWTNDRRCVVGPNALLGDVRPGVVGSPSAPQCALLDSVRYAVLGPFPLGEHKLLDTAKKTALGERRAGVSDGEGADSGRGAGQGGMLRFFRLGLTLAHDVRNYGFGWFAARCADGLGQTARLETLSIADVHETHIAHLLRVRELASAGALELEDQGVAAARIGRGWFYGLLGRPYQERTG
ncbi:hypothetical protein B0H10DRAFT_1962918 [Mycena sp. CBHHK59/15]|nr:hypothetical protein B0H10DRAFT_1962918 [Mycena sp. CBHHK59/15]